MIQRHSSISPDVAPAKEEAPASDYAMQRVAPRTAGSLVPGIEAVRLLPLGVEGSVVDISTRGALILCCKKLSAGMAARIVFLGTHPPKPVSGKVVRSLVSKIGQTGELWYHVGIAFNEPIEFESPTSADRQIDESNSQPEQPPAPPKFVNRW
jgi:hypothetical protein